jgi:hypothetical protein
MARGFLLIVTGVMTCASTGFVLGMDLLWAQETGQSYLIVNEAINMRQYFLVVFAVGFAALLVGIVARSEWEISF